MFDLRAWLRRTPKPRKLRLRVGEDDRIVDLGEGRYKWAEVEQTVRLANASVVECLDKDGNILRTTMLDADDSEGTTDDEVRGKFEEKLLGKDRMAQAAMLDAYGKRLNEAHAMGAKAAGVSQENLVGIVETLSNHLSLAITNLHTLSGAYANAVATQGGQGDDTATNALGLLIAAMGGKLGLAAATPAPATPAKKNGGG